jgi:TatD DNase family protein
MLIDTHAHLDFSQFDEDRSQVIQHAFQSGLKAILNVGIDFQTSMASIDLAEEYEGMFAVVGYHPHEAKHLNGVALTKLQALAKDKHVVAIGEIGLDYYRNRSPRAAQQEAFRQQIHLARKLRLPVVVHIRQAYEDAMTILQEEHASEVGGVLHCFSGDKEMAAWAIREGFHLSFTGVVTFPRSQALSIASTIPIDTLLLETDCPFLAPVPQRGRRNEPSYVSLTATCIAESRGISVDRLAESTTRTAKRLFRLPNSL